MSGASMPTPFAATLELLRRVLTLEQRQGYRNNAATGGLYRYFHQQFDRQDLDATTAPVAEGLLRDLKRYEALGSVEERAQQVVIVLKHVEEALSGRAMAHEPVATGPVADAHRGDSAALARIRRPSPPTPLPAAGEGGRQPSPPSHADWAVGSAEPTAQPVLPAAGEGGRTAVSTRPVRRGNGDSWETDGREPSPQELAIRREMAREAGLEDTPGSTGSTAPREVSGAIDTLDTRSPLPRTGEGSGVRVAPRTGRAAEGEDSVPPLPRTGEGPGVRVVSLEQPLADVLKIRPQELEKLERLGLRTVEDAIRHFPRDHYDYRNPVPINKLRAGMTTTLQGVLQAVDLRTTARKHVIVEAKVADSTAVIRVGWFNQRFMAAQLRPHIGQRVAISGHTELFNGRLQFVPRDVEFPNEEDLGDSGGGGELTHTGRLVPVYPLTEGLTGRWLRNTIRRTLDAALHLVVDPLPPALRDAHNLLPLDRALYAYHLPADEEEKAAATRRLAFEELFYVGIGMARRKREWQQGPPAHPVARDPAALEEFTRSLPFALTGAQRRVLDTILADMARAVPMSRLLQGDVGSGKTVVAAAALLLAARAGWQGALMAPTEILAEQHARSLARLLEPFGVEVALLTGSVKGAERKRVYAGAADGSIPVLVGTQALIQEGVAFDCLALAVVDEQHRFGVGQRAGLRQKGFNPHVLAMTATPIPRTLSLTIYGDLDVAVIDERPPGRQPIDTQWVPSDATAYRMVREQVTLGRQAYVICPLVEETDKSEARAAVAEHKRLQREVFPDLVVGLVHGRLKGSEKEAVLARFRDGEIQVLVATSVVEVGIDVPNATVMVVQEANRFGLAQLHQFRGRVGRGAEQSYCLLLAESASAIGQQRLQAITSTDDGFKLAEEDLRLRGPGEFWGTRQSGLPALTVAGMGDVRAIEEARDAATRLVEEDPDLARPEHRLLSQQVERFWNRGVGSERS